MRNVKNPNTDSIAELADFWDTHDLTDFDDQLEEVTEPVFERKNVIKIPLAAKEMNSVQNIAHARGVRPVDLVRSWVLEKIHA